MHGGDLAATVFSPILDGGAVWVWPMGLTVHVSERPTRLGTTQVPSTDGHAAGESDFDRLSAMLSTRRSDKEHSAFVGHHLRFS